MDPAYIDTVRALCGRISMSAFDTVFRLRIERDVKAPKDGRAFLQVEYDTPCVTTGERRAFRGRKWYLSDHMIDDEVVKTALAAFEATMRHECLEGFKVDGVTLVNPHVHFEELLRISSREVSRADPAAAEDT